MSLFGEMVVNKAGMPALPKDLPSSEETFSQMDWEDTWVEAEVVSTCHWLRGARILQSLPLSDHICRLNCEALRMVSLQLERL